MDKLHAFLEFMRPHWSWLALVGTWVGIAIIALRRRQHWRSKHFWTQVNFSLNYRIGDQLAMRTLLESTAPEVWPNEYGVRKVLSAAARTTIEQPFILLDDSRDQEFVNRAVLNALSERFAEVFVAASLGLPVRTGTYCFAVTCEKYVEIRTLKLRVLIMEEQALHALFGPEGMAEQLVVKNHVYRARLQTLRGLYALYLEDQKAEHPVLGRMELGVLLPAGSTVPAGGNGSPCGTSAAQHA
jgi:hypothetical protein